MLEVTFLLQQIIQVQPQASLCVIFGGQSGTGTASSPRTSVLFLVIITPVLHTHSSIADAM